MKLLHPGTKPNVDSRWRNRADMEKREYLNAMLEAVKLPARISDLNTGLTDVNRDALSHLRRLGVGCSDGEGRLKEKTEEERAFIKTPMQMPVSERMHGKWKGIYRPRIKQIDVLGLEENFISICYPKVSGFSYEFHWSHYNILARRVQIWIS